jgi:hypothetical protein
MHVLFFAGQIRCAVPDCLVHGDRPNYVRKKVFGKRFLRPCLDVF